MTDSVLTDVDEEITENKRANAHCRIAKRRARHARAVASALNASALEFVTKDADEDDDGQEADPGEIIARVARETEETFRRDSEAFDNVEREAMRAYLKLAREASDEMESNILFISQERERARRERATESRYQFRRDMLDDAEASGDANDVLVEGWNELLLSENGSERVDCMTFHDRFAAQVRACKRAFEPKETLARRLKAYLIAEVDATYDSAIATHSGELADAARISADARAQRESVASNVLRESLGAFVETLRLRNATRARALSKVDQLLEDEAQSRLDHAQTHEGIRRSSLTSLVLENASTVRCLRDHLDRRVEETRSALHLAVASAPLNSERLHDALRRRVAEEANRRAKARAADRALKAARAELMEAKRRYAETETTCADLEDTLENGVRMSAVRLEVATGRSDDGEDKARSILELKRAQIESLHRQLEEMEVEISCRVLHVRARDTRRAPVRVRARALEALETAMRMRDDARGAALASTRIVTQQHSFERSTRCA